MKTQQFGALKGTKKLENTPEGIRTPNPRFRRLTLIRLRFDPASRPLVLTCQMLCSGCNIAFTRVQFG